MAKSHNVYCAKSTEFQGNRYTDFLYFCLQTLLFTGLIGVVLVLLHFACALTDTCAATQAGLV